MRLPKQSRPVRVQVPMDLRADIGLGDTVKALTSKMGIRPCAPCEQRAAAMNRYLTFTGRSQARR